MWAPGRADEASGATGYLRSAKILGGLFIWRREGKPCRTSRSRALALAQERLAFVGRRRRDASVRQGREPARLRQGDARLHRAQASRGGAASKRRTLPVASSMLLGRHHGHRRRGHYSLRQPRGRARSRLPSPRVGRQKRFDYVHPDLLEEAQNILADIWSRSGIHPPFEFQMLARMVPAATSNSSSTICWTIQG